MGPYGVELPLVAAPRRTRPAPASSVSRVLPIPASPETSSSEPAPDHARRIAAASRAPSASRPTSALLTSMPQPATGAGSGRTTTVSATGVISSAGIPLRSACARIVSGLSAS